MEKPTIAICYDFDMTLSPKYMQDYKFFKDIGYKANEFWVKKNEFCEKNNADQILINMYSMVDEARQKGIILTKEKFKEYGKDVELFPGVDTWFDRINQYGDQMGVNVEHYIISSGIKEMIEGTSIAKHFKKIYACSYIYNEQGEPIWPAVSVNYTNKTQYLFRINKGCLNEYDKSINDILDEDNRSVPFENMIYIGDSETDIPCMRIVFKNGGRSIGVYSGEKQKAYLKDLLANGRINYMALADYSKGEMLETIIKEIIKSDKINFNLKQLSKLQKKG